jgi:Ca2+-transporting ATPase
VALASKGLRVLAVASRRLPAVEVLGDDGSVLDPDAWVGELTLDALIGIVDPPRSEARDAIALCAKAGVSMAIASATTPNAANTIRFISLAPFEPDPSLCPVSLPVRHQRGFLR